MYVTSKMLSTWRVIIRLQLLLLLRVVVSESHSQWYGGACCLPCTIQAILHQGSGVSWELYTHTVSPKPHGFLGGWSLHFIFWPFTVTCLPTSSASCAVNIRLQSSVAETLGRFLFKSPCHYSRTLSQLE